MAVHHAPLKEICDLDDVADFDSDHSYFEGMKFSLPVITKMNFRIGAQIFIAVAEILLSSDFCGRSFDPLSHREYHLITASGFFPRSTFKSVTCVLCMWFCPARDCKETVAFRPPKYIRLSGLKSMRYYIGLYPGGL